jgi:hypothetical protein
LPPIHKKSIRILFNNTNALQTEKPAILANSLKSYFDLEPSILGLIETRRNWKRANDTSNPLRTMATALQGNNKARAKLVTASCREDHTANDIPQPGGVAQLTVSRILNMFRTAGSDKLGRWAWQSFRLDGTQSLYVITAYRVCNEPDRKTTAMTTTWHQQKRALIKQGIKTDPRKRFLQDFRDFLLDLKNNGHLYIVGWDANDAHSSDDVATLLEEADMADAFTDFFDERPPTHNRGALQIDQISMSPSLLQYIDNAFILDPTHGEGDHSYVGIDFDIASLVNRRSIRDVDPGHNQNRLLVSTDVKRRMKYLNVLKKKQEGHNTPTRMRELWDRCLKTHQCSENDRRIFQSICTQMYKNAKQAEASCKTGGPFSWSRMLAAAGLAVQLANREYREALSGLFNPNHPNRESAIARAKANRRNSYQVLEEIQARANDLRETDFELQIEEEAAKTNSPKEAVLRAILRREREAEIFPILATHVGGKTHHQLDELWTPDNPQDLNDTTWTSHVRAEAIWEALITHGEQHFSQASDTPFVSGPISQLLGPFEFNSISKQILDGTFDIDSITQDLDVRDMVKAMAHSDPLNPLISDSELTIEKLKLGFRYIKESTGSNPEGLHHGHWKSLIQDDEAFEPFALMIMFAFRWGEPPDTWKNALQVILPKDDPTEPIKSTRIRRIQLVCAGMNMGFRIIWGHEMMQRATMYNHLSNVQFGARSGHMSLSAVLLKRTSYDIIRLMRLVATIFDCDATACYDRMIPSQCMILAAREGVPENAIKTQLRILEENKYKVKTAHGVSPTSFRNSISHTILGMLQGSAAVGALWGLVSTLLFTVLGQRSQRARFPSPRPGFCPKRDGEAFVDDTTLWNTLPGGSSVTRVVANAAHKAQTWAKLLWVTGGKLNLKKCYWYAVSWSFKPTGEPVLSSISDDPHLRIDIKQGSDPTTSVERVEATVGRRTLGARLSPDGKDNEEFLYRKKEGIKLRKRMLRAPLNRESTVIGFRSIARTKMEHTLPITCFSDQQCEAIQNTYLPTFLSKMGINRSTRTEVRTGPAIYTGMEVPEVRTTQAAGANKMMISHLRKNDLVGKSIMASIDCLQLHAGTSWPVLSQDGTLVRKYVTGTDRSWAMHLWQFNDQHDLAIKINDPHWLRIQRVHDSFIMDRIVALPNITTTELKAVQRCRLFLQATTISDLTNSSGTALADWISDPNLDLTNYRTSHLLYPHQARPTSATWNLFMRKLQLAYTSNNNILITPLGNWYQGRFHQAWHQMYCRTTDTIYSFTISPSPKVCLFKRRNSRTRLFRYLRTHSSISFPRNPLPLIPVTGRFQQGHFITDTTLNASTTPTMVPPPPPDIDTSEADMIKNLTFKNGYTAETIANELRLGKVIVGTDGSVLNENGTYGVAILSTTGDEPTLMAVAGGHLPDLARFVDMDSHRPEAAGLHCALYLLRRILNAAPSTLDTPSTMPIDIVLDNQSVVDDLDWYFDINTSVYDYLKPDYDILQAINHSLDRIPMRCNIQWVKGHQIDHKDWDQLSIAAKANYYADEICTQMQQTSPDLTGLYPAWAPGLNAGLLHHGKLITKKQDEQVITAATAPRLQTVMCKKSQKRDPNIHEPWTDDTFNTIDWLTVRSSFKSQAPGRKLQIAKFTHEWTPTMHQRALMDNSLDRRCFACQHLCEDINHVLRCTSPRRIVARTKALDDFQNHLSRYFTPAPMTSVIMSCLRKWYDGRIPVILLLPTDDSDSNAVLHRLINTAYNQQCTIGWGHFIRGRLTHAWKAVIAHYYRDRRPGHPFNPTLWMRKTIDQVWLLFRTIWLCRNGEKYGKDYDEQRAIALETTRNKVREIYEQARSDVDSVTSSRLHAQPLEEILKWTKRHLDAYLATAEVYLAQNIDPG